MTVQSVHKGGIGEALAEHALHQVRGMKDAEVLEALRHQGITSLEDLVKKSLVALHQDVVHSPGAGVARDTFIYTQAIYKSEMPITPELIQELSAKVQK